MVWFLLALLSIGCASTGAQAVYPVRVRGVWFTNVETVGSQTYDVGSATPERLYPAVEVFQRGRDPKAILVIAFPNGDAHSMRAVLKDSSGAARRPIDSSIGSLPRISTWRTAKNFVRWKIFCAGRISPPPSVAHSRPSAR